MYDQAVMDCDFGEFILNFSFHKTLNYVLADLLPKSGVQM